MDFTSGRKTCAMISSNGEVLMQLNKLADDAR
jgi:hypothetical protein